MNIENKQRIIDNLFENKFNLDNFKEFVANILNFRVENNEESPKIFATFLSYIISYQVISNYTDIEKNKMTVMCVKIKEDKDPIRARVKQREFIAKLLRNSSKDGALVVFYNEDSLHWRMSFIRLNYEFTMKGIEERITPAKRLSYVVGEGEACKTAKDQFYTLANLKESISLNKLEEVFALEKVTKDFFEEYKDKYEEIKKILIDDKNFMAEARKHESEKPESFADGFTKKLMGQISFIYFLQKKGWLGIKIIPESMNLENFNKFYKSASEKGKTILTKIYEREEQDLFLLNKEKMKKLNNKIDGEILARIFINSEFFNEWGTGDKKFLKTLFNNHLEQDKDNGKTFFEDYLEILFYNNLSEDRGELQYSIDFNSRIPFLNGGLFDPYGNYDWDKTSFNLNDELFYNGKDGILDIFDRYNFTINENDSYETEVAVDPEMLGKVFENLLDISEKKSKGAFYTPREIVRYMTNESIINYLLANLKDTNIKKEELDYLFNLGEFSKEYDLQKFEQDFLKHGIPLKDEKGKPQLDMKRNIIINCKKIDDLLKKVKIADPACGSGAFPLGLLNEIVRARNVLTFYINMTEFFKEKEKEKKKYWKRKFESDEKRSLYNLKLETIQNCLYGVDIEPSAIDITKLRLWLSIIIDSDNNNVRPLPNLDFNFMIGNSLIDEFEGMKLFDETLLNDEVLKKETNKGKIGRQKSLLGSESIKQGILEDIFSKQARFFTEKNLENKKRLKEEIEKLEISLIKFTLEVNQNLSKLNEIEKGRRERRKPYFLWKLEFAKVFKENGGFDIVLGNPPYVGEGKKKEIFIPVQKTSFGEKYYIGKMDFWYFFTSLGIELLKENGILNYIAPNNWTTTTGEKKMRNHIMEEMIIKEFIDFGDYMAFENVDQQTMILLLEKNKTDEMLVKYSKIINCNNVKMYDFLNKYQSEQYLYSNVIIKRNEYKKNNIINFLLDNNETIIKKMKNNKEIYYLKENEIAQGIVPNPDVIGKRNIIKISENKIKEFNIKIGDGVFVVPKDYFKVLTNEEREIIVPLYETENVDRYMFNPNNKKEIIYLTANIEEDKYPNILNHLSKFKEIMEERRENLKGSRKYYNLHWGREKEFFTVGEKILVVRKCPKYPIFSYTEEMAFVMLSFNIIKTLKINMKYLTGLLNSKLIAFWLRYMGKMQGSNYQIDKEPLMNIPIKMVSNEIEEKIITLVERIIELKKLDKDTQDLENQIDEMVYDLYELTEEEKKLVREF